MIISRAVAHELVRLQHSIEAACVELPAALRHLRTETAALRRNSEILRERAERLVAISATARLEL